MSPLGKVEMSPFVPRKPTLLKVLNGRENNNARGETLRQWMIEWGLWKAKRQKEVRHHPQRARRDCLGELIQQIARTKEHFNALIRE